MSEQQLDHNRVVQALRAVQDPVTGQDIITAKKVKDFRIADGRVFFTLALQPDEAKYKSDLTFACIQAIQAVYPNVDVNVHAVTDETAGVLHQVKHIIAVGSGKGGVGKSTVSTNLALGLRKKGYKVGLIDADLYGPSIPTMLGLSDAKPKVKKIFGANKIVPLEAHGLYFISIGNIVDAEQAVVLRGPRLGGIIKQFVKEVLWPDLDFLVIDLPPGTGDIQLTLVQTLSITGAVMVTTPQKMSIIDAVKAANMFRLDHINVPILGVVENMSWFTPEELPDNKYYLFGQDGGKELAKHCRTVLLGQLPLVQSVREHGDEGVPEILDENSSLQTRLMDVTDKLLVQLAERLTSLPPTQKVEIKT
jgi:ATP-binding protein involved in chromosome partitioning